MSDLLLDYEPVFATEVHWWEHYCWYCNDRMAVWWVEDGLAWSSQRPEAESAVIDTIAEAIAGRGLEQALIGEVFSTVLQEEYVGFSCPHCTKLQGDFYLERDFNEMLKNGFTNRVVLPEPVITDYRLVV